MNRSGGGDAGSGVTGDTTEGTVRSVRTTFSRARLDALLTCKEMGTELKEPERSLRTRDKLRPFHGLLYTI
jgi:hypothetical protein